MRTYIAGAHAQHDPNQPTFQSLYRVSHGNRCSVLYCYSASGGPNKHTCCQHVRPSLPDRVPLLPACVVLAVGRQLTGISLGSLTSILPVVRSNGSLAGRVGRRCRGERTGRPPTAIQLSQSVANSGHCNLTCAQRAGGELELRAAGPRGEKSISAMDTTTLPRRCHRPFFYSFCHATELLDEDATLSYCFRGARILTG